MSFLLLMASGMESPSFDLPFMGGQLPAGLTYTNSSTTRTYFGADGLLKTAGVNEPVFEYDPVTLALLGMRWEMEQRTNLALYSTLPGGGAAPTGWTQVIGSGTSAPASSIYGNADGSVAYLHSAVIGERPYVQQAVTLSANTTYTASVLVEAIEGSPTVGDVIYSSSLPSGTRSFFLNGVSVATTDPLAAGVVEMRLAIGATGGVIAARFGVGASGTATGTMSVKFSRPQLESGTSRSSFIPTTTAAVTRQPDVLTATSISPWFNASEGTVVFEGIVDNFNASRGFYVFSDNTTNELIRAYSDTSAQFSGNIVDGGAAQANITLGGQTAGAVFRNVLSYKLNSVQAANNGILGTADTNATIPTVSRLDFGRYTASGALPFMGYARRFQYFPKRLPDAQIQGMSRV